MKKVSCVVIDDEPDSRDLIVSYIDEFVTSLSVMGQAGDVASGVELIKNQKPELVFLDISMPDGSGFDLLEQLDTIDFSLVFVTAFEQYAIKAFDYAAISYLMKPISVTDLEKVAERHAKRKSDKLIREKLKVLKANRNGFKKIALPVSTSYEFIEVKKIIRCEGEGGYTTFHIDGRKEVMVSKSLSTFEDLLPDDRFFRIHKKHLINLAHVKKYVKGKTGYVIMSDDSHADLAYPRRDRFLEMLKDNFGFI